MSCADPWDDRTQSGSQQVGARHGVPSSCSTCRDRTTVLRRCRAAKLDDSTARFPRKEAAWGNGRFPSAPSAQRRLEDRRDAAGRSARNWLASLGRGGRSRGPAARLLLSALRLLGTASTEVPLPLSRCERWVSRQAGRVSLRSDLILGAVAPASPWTVAKGQRPSPSASREERASHHEVLGAGDGEYVQQRTRLLPEPAGPPDSDLGETAPKRAVDVQAPKRGSRPGSLSCVNVRHGCEP